LLWGPRPLLYRLEHVHLRRLLLLEDLLLSLPLLLNLLLDLFQEAKDSIGELLPLWFCALWKRLNASRAAAVDSL